MTRQALQLSYHFGRAEVLQIAAQVPKISSKLVVILMSQNRPGSGFINIEIVFVFLSINNQIRFSQQFISQTSRINSMKSIEGAERLKGFDKPTVWTVMTPLAIKTQSINLGQGFPTWSPPQFYLDYLRDSVLASNHQYTRAYGSLSLTKAIANFHAKNLGPIDHENEIVTVNGGVEGLFSCIMGLMNQDDQAILFDPSYDCYRPQIQMAGGKAIGIPLKPRKNQSKQQLIKRFENQIQSSEDDEWDVDYQAFEKALNPKTKILIINNPHNPVGKVFRQAELEKIGSILQKYPNVVVLEDNVYEGMTFDDMYGQQLPKMTRIKSVSHRTLSIYSAGKIFAATGVRSGWVIGPSPLIKAVRSVHQYNVFCSYNVVENAIAKSLQYITRPESTYILDAAQKLTKHRNLLIRQLLKSNLDIDLWVPKGGYFVVVDISRIIVNEKYFIDQKGQPRTKDFAFAFQLAYENGVVCIPCSPFYDKEAVQLGSRYVRFAFCKDESMLIEASKRLNK